VLSCLIAMVALWALLVSMRTRNDQNYIKWFESFNSLVNTEHLFEGKLDAHALTGKVADDEKVNPKMLMYYDAMLTTIWIGISTNQFRVKRLRRIRFFMRKHTYEKMVTKALEMDKKIFFIHPESYPGRLVRSESFIYAWEEYLHRFWNSSPRGITSVIINATISNYKESEIRNPR